jgi:pimeloyl-ACP methyl ester carboxylesterase
MLRKSFHHRKRIPETLIDDVVHEMRSGSDRSARLNDLLMVERSVSWAHTERDLRLVHAPTLLLWGAKDRYFPPRLLERFATRLPTAEHHVLSDCGHSVHDDCPEQTYALLFPFLQRQATHVS